MNYFYTTLKKLVTHIFALNGSSRSVMQCGKKEKGIRHDSDNVKCFSICLIEQWWQDYFLRSWNRNNEDCTNFC